MGPLGKLEAFTSGNDISPIVKEAVKEWLSETMLAPEPKDKKSDDSIETLGEKIIKALMREHKGKGPKAVKQAFNELKPQIEFVGSLIYSINEEIDKKRREMSLETALLVEEFKRIVGALTTSELARLTFESLSSMPYPLSEGMADLLLNLNEHALEPCNEMKERILPYMVKEHFVTEGKKEIPLRWLHLLRASNPSESEAESIFSEEIEGARSIFESPEAFDDFLNKRDFTHGLADIRDEEFDRAVEALAKEVESLSHAGVFETGEILQPDDFPNYFMANIPLIEEKWIDKAALELLEWVKILLDRRYETVYLEENNPLAWPIIFKLKEDEKESEDDSLSEEDYAESATEEEFDDDDDEEEEEEEPEILDKETQYAILLEAKRHLASLELEERVIDGRLYVSIDDYFSKEERYLNEGDFQREKGIMIRSWNNWIEEHESDETAKIAGFNVFTIEHEIEPEQIHRVKLPREALTLQASREQGVLAMTKMQLSIPVPISSLKEKGIEDSWYANSCISDDEPARALIASWRDSVFKTLANYAGMKIAIKSIADEFLDGAEFVPEEIMEPLDNVIIRIAGLIAAYNDIIADQLNMLKSFGLIRWTDNPPYGWGALFPQGFFIDMDEVSKAAENYALSHMERYIDIAQPQN